MPNSSELNAQAWPTRKARGRTILDQDNIIIRWSGGGGPIERSHGWAATAAPFRCQNDAEPCACGGQRGALFGRHQKLWSLELSALNSNE